jgi:hypothetical protein
VQAKAQLLINKAFVAQFDLASQYYKNTNINPLWILNNANFNVVNVSIKDKLVNVLHYC